jgi:predicted metal-binding membrane protein
MMAAMMLSVAPTIAVYSRMNRLRSRFSPLLFAAGYLATGGWGPVRIPRRPGRDPGPG